MEGMRNTIGPSVAMNFLSPFRARALDHTRSSLETSSTGVGWSVRVDGVLDYVV